MIPQHTFVDVLNHSFKIREEMWTEFVSRTGYKGEHIGDLFCSLEFDGGTGDLVPYIGTIVHEYKRVVVPFWDFFSGKQNIKPILIANPSIVSTRYDLYSCATDLYQFYTLVEMLKISKKLAVDYSITRDLHNIDVYTEKFQYTYVGFYIAYSKSNTIYAAVDSKMIILGNLDKILIGAPSSSFAYNRMVNIVNKYTDILKGETDLGDFANMLNPWVTSDTPIYKSISDELICALVNLSPDTTIKIRSKLGNIVISNNKEIQHWSYNLSRSLMIIQTKNGKSLAPPNLDGEDYKRMGFVNADHISMFVSVLNTMTPKEKEQLTTEGLLLLQQLTSPNL